MKKVNQLRADRGHSMDGWRAGGDGNRWPGDDGRHISEVDALRMRLDALEGNSTPLQQIILAAERQYFEDRDAVYEEAKAASP